MIVPDQVPRGVDTRLHPRRDHPPSNLLVYFSHRVAEKCAGDSSGLLGERGDSVTSRENFLRERTRSFDERAASCLRVSDVAISMAVVNLLRFAAGRSFGTSGRY